MTWVKVCGLRTTIDIEVAAAAGADAVGLVLAESPRRVEADVAARLARSSPVPVFLLMVDAVPAEMLDLAGFVGASGIQPYGRNAAEVAAVAVRAGLTVLRPVAVRERVEEIDVPVDQIPLFDNGSAGVRGGSGIAFDHGLLPTLDRQWVLAGGLDGSNVAEAIRRTGAWGVDASSRLESSPGTKDPDLIRSFVESAKRI